jgi:uncharacterized protein (TIGR03083 family)
VRSSSKAAQSVRSDQRADAGSLIDLQKTSAAWTNAPRLWKTVSVGAVDVWQETVGLRLRFAERIESLDETAWNSTSWCQGWLIRDVLAHLVQNAERTYTSLTFDLIRGGFGPDRAMSKAAIRFREIPVPELAGRLRRAADRHFHLPGSTEAMGLADVLVHSSDAFRPVGLEVDAHPASVGPALDALWKSGRLVVHAVPHHGRRLVATDLAWSRGNGPEVRGKAIDLLSFIANRRQVVRRLEGGSPGFSGEMLR